MDNFTESQKRDLHLSFSRKSAPQWKINESPAKYIQPMLVYPTSNGNVYIQGSCLNDLGKELSTKELADLIDKYGTNVLSHLDGNFVIAVDDHLHGVWCATDHSATLPLYYKVTSGEVIITSRPENMKIKDSSGLDVSGIITSLISGHPWGTLTLLNEWRVLRPGQVLSLDTNDNFSIKTYFNPEVDEQIQGFKSPHELLKEIDDGLISIASRHKKLLLPLSGGVDSRLIAMECHKLGIPFEAITFVANKTEGDDFDIASRLVKVLNVKHHRWEWSPSPADCVDNFKRLCIASSGTNDAYTSYPDGMKFFTEVASQFDAVMRGDHSFGFGHSTTSIDQSAFELGIYYKDDLSWTLKDPYQRNIKVEPIFKAEEEASFQLNEREPNAWRHMSRRLSKNPRFHLAIGQLQAQHTVVTYPLLTKNMVQRMSRTETAKRNDKLLAREALAIASPPDIKRIPHSSQQTWRNGEPLLSLPNEVIHDMAEILSQHSVLSDLINEAMIATRYNPLSNCSTEDKVAKATFLSSLKQLVKSIIPKKFLHSYQPPLLFPRAEPHMVFKRLFAMKVYLNSISGTG
jgi:hypothetical protein